jgi:putative oxidoreductase
MQRLFSTFPNGWPGCGLLVLRLACALPLLAFGAAHFRWGWPADFMQWERLASGLAGLFILAGLWTPFAAATQAALQGVLALAAPAFVSAELVLAMVGVGLMMLGPGAWSVDARLYGRKRIDLPSA